MTLIKLLINRSRTKKYSHYFITILELIVLKIKIVGDITPLHHRDYDGKRVNIRLTDNKKMKLSYINLKLIF